MIKGENRLQHFLNWFHFICYFCILIINFFFCYLNCFLCLKSFLNQSFILCVRWKTYLLFFYFKFKSEYQMWLFKSWTFQGHQERDFMNIRIIETVRRNSLGIWYQDKHTHILYTYFAKHTKLRKVMTF